MRLADTEYKQLRRAILCTVRTYFPTASLSGDAIVDTEGWKVETVIGSEMGSDLYKTLQLANRRAIEKKEEAAVFPITWLRATDFDRPASLGLGGYQKLFKKIDKAGRTPRLDLVVINAEDFKRILKKLVKIKKKIKT